MKSIYSDVQWNQWISDYRNSGLSLAKWCDLNNVPIHSMRYHLYVIHSSNSNHSNSNLVPVVFTDTIDQPSSSLNIVIDNASISVDESTDLSLLKKVLEVLR